MPGFRLNPALEAELRAQPQLLTALLHTAQGIAGEAQRIGHAEAYDPDSGGPHYVDEIDATLATDGDGRPVGRVRANKFTSGWVEFGFHDRSGRWHEGKAVLRRAAEAKGE